jgi:hypothetical protein
VVVLPSAWYWAMPVAGLAIWSGAVVLAVRVCRRLRRRLPAPSGGGVPIPWVGKRVRVDALAAAAYAAAVLGVPLLAWLIATRAHVVGLVAVFAAAAALLVSALGLFRVRGHAGGRPGVGVRLRAAGCWKRLRRRPLPATAGVLGVIAFCYLLRHPPAPQGPPAHDRLFLFERATNVANGVSPAALVVLLGLAFVWWAVSHLRRLYLLEKAAVGSPFAGAEGERARAAALAHRPAQEALEAPHRGDWAGLAFAFWILLFFTFCRLANRFVPTVEGPWFDALALWALAVYATLLVAGLVRALGLWKRTQALLREVAKLPLRDAYGRVPARIKSAFGPYLSSLPPDSRTLAAERWRQRGLVLEQYERARDPLRDELGLAAAAADELDQELSGAPRDPAAGGGVAPDWSDRLRATSRGCLNVLARFWDRLSVGEAGGERREPGGAAGPPAPQGDGPPEARCPEVRRWCVLAEDYLALEVINYLSQFFIQLRNQVVFLTVASLLLLAVVLSYPLEPQRLWVLLAAALIVAVIVVGLKLFIAIERDQVVSEVLGSTPNRVNFHWTFVSNVLLYTAPLVGVLLATSTDLADLLNSWLSPLFQVLR